MKNILKNIAIILLFITSESFAQTSVTIVKGTINAPYTVTGTESLLALQSITLLPNTWIKSGSTFVASVNSDAYTSSAFSNENYIFSRTFQKAMTNTAGITNNSDVIENITYFDGLGRPMQNIAIKASPSKQDLVTHIGYDGFGRQDKDYLPYMAHSGDIASFRPGADSNTNAYYIANYPTDINSTSPNPFSQKLFENSPLNRVMQQAAPGKDWALASNHEIKIEYQTNVSSEVKLFTATTTWDPTNEIYDIALGNAAGTTFYNANELYKTIIKDENWIASPTTPLDHTSEEFKDKEGRVVLKRAFDLNIPHDTYYVYDIYGNLTYVITPKVAGTVSQTILNDLCYQYKYDSRNRLVEKKLPGKQWEFIVYDKLDRPVLTQDANLRTQNKWLFTKYDAFTRPIYTGEYTNTALTNRKLVQDLANGTILFESKTTTPTTINGTAVNYTNTAFPSTSINVFTINYYDNYQNFDLDGGTAVASYGITPITNAKGLLTATKVRILGTSLWTTTVNYYDAKARGIYSYSKNNFLTTVSTTKTNFDFVKALETTTTHQKGTAAAITIVDAFTYDHMGRVLNQKQKINSQNPETVAANTYDNLGQLTTKAVGGTTTPLQTINYKYNIRGWLKNINDINNISDDLFAFMINYNDIADANKKLYNGNISQTLWKTANTDTNLKNYTYTYDALNRLTLAESHDAGRYNESMSYDKNGNIMSLFRLGNTILNTQNFGPIDNLTYVYDAGNKLLKVEDSYNNAEGFNNGSSGSNTDYTYDANGNMQTDANKGITTAITYNHLNLPMQITFPTGNIQYVYDATGVKQRKIVSTGVTTDYAGGFIYENNNLKFFSQPEGYVSYNSGTFDYIYQYKDQLGNVRLSYDKNLVIVEENNYYPFGLKQQGYNNNPNALGSPQAQKYKYNGKELQDELGLGVYFFKFRSYDPALGRFWQIDPLAGTYAHNSTYAFAENNVSSGTDLEGLELSFNLNGNLATAQNGPRVTGGINGNYTLQELKSHMAQKQAQEDRAMNKLMSGDPRSLPQQGEIRPAKGDINVARFDDPGMMIADGARIGAEIMATDIAIAKVFQGIGAIGKGRSVWAANALERGRRIEKTLGENLGWNFPTLDKVSNGVATSIKSLDLGAASYQKGNSVLNTLKGYINKLDNFTSGTWGGQTVTEGVSYTSKSLELAVQTGKGSESQWTQIADAIKYAQDKNINVTIRFIK